jgi:hypothetical protein
MMQARFFHLGETPPRLRFPVAVDVQDANVFRGRGACGPMVVDVDDLSGFEYRFGRQADLVSLARCSPG